MKEDINALDELNKGACIGMDAIHFILDKVDDEKFKSSLEVQYNKYKDISNQINDIYANYNETENPHETNIFTKTMTWYGIEMKTVTDHSDSKIAEILLKGTNMGIIEGRKILNNKKLDKEVQKIASTYVAMQEDSVENLKKYL